MMDNASALPTCPQRQNQPQTADRNGPKITHTTSRWAKILMRRVGLEHLSTSVLPWCP